MQYGSIMGHAPANLAFVAVLTSASLCLLSVSTDGLRLPLLQTCTASFASFIDFYSPSLGQLVASTDGLRFPLF